MSFGAYMNLALYDPTEGFYAAGGGAGRRRDFLTSPEVGPLFGQVVANALDTWWRELGSPDPFFVLEGGAGPGSLARGILRAQPSCAKALRYVMVDVAAAQRASHGDHLTLSAPDKVLDPAPQPGPLVCSVAELPTVDGTGVVLVNELFDNLAFDIVEYDAAHGWSNVLVDLGVGSLVEKLVPTDATYATQIRTSDARVPQRMPLQAAAQKWLGTALRSVRAGKVVAFDYMVEQYPVGSRQWLRTYRGHEEGGDPLQHPGSQDITADVALDQLAAVQEPSRVRRQSMWLRHFGITELVAEGRAYWQKHASNPDLAAVQARSRITESEALLDSKGLGAFRVAEWNVTST